MKLVRVMWLHICNHIDERSNLILATNEPATSAVEDENQDIRIMIAERTLSVVGE